MDLPTERRRNGGISTERQWQRFRKERVLSYKTQLRDTRNISQFIFNNSFFFLFLLISSVSISAQEFKVESMTIAEGDLSAATSQRLDLNGSPCALVKVQVPLRDVVFEGNVIGEPLYRGGEYWVYMTPNSKFLNVKHETVSPTLIEFSELDVAPLEAKTTYLLRLSRPILSGFTSDKEAYKKLALQARESFAGKNFSKARELYNQVVADFPDLNIESDFNWVSLCDSIIEAQKKFTAVTPALASAFKDVSSYWDLQGFNEGAIVIEGMGGRAVIITEDGKRTDLNDTYLRGNRAFREGLLPVNFNGSNCYIDRNGSIRLNYRSSDYNKYFQDDEYDFNRFNNGFATIFNSKNGKRGIINKFGKTILEPTGKYKGIHILKDRIILYDNNTVYNWSIPSAEYADMNPKDIDRLFKYDGYIHEVTDEVIIYSSKELNELNVYVGEEGRLYTFPGQHPRLTDSEWIAYNNGNGIYVFNFKDGSIKAGTLKEPAFLNDGEEIVYGNADIYNFNPITNELKRIPTSGFFLVKTDKTYRYVDLNGKTLPNSEFKRSEEVDRVMKFRNTGFKENFGVIARGKNWGLIDRFGITTFDYQ